MNFGVFRGNILQQTKGKIGAGKNVFANFTGIKNELVYPYNGGVIMNPPKGNGFKFFTGDLMEYRTDDNYANPEIYLLKTYLVVDANATAGTVTILRDNYKHVPYVGDVIGVAPATLGGAIAEPLTVTAVQETVVSNVKVWVLTVTGDVDAVEDDILVEADEDGNMLVKKINAFADCDMDMPYAGSVPSASYDDFEAAKYLYTPAVGGASMLISKMQPLPECVLAVNESQFNGIFKLKSVV